LRRTQTPAALSIIILVILGGCSGDDGGGAITPPPPLPVVLTDNYSGTLTLRYQNIVIPQFSESVTLDVSVDTHGRMKIERGTLDYDAEASTAEIRVRRVGAITINALGAWSGDGGEDVFNVTDNCLLDETATTWTWTGAAWQQTDQDRLNETWDHGLVFHLEHAVSFGAVVAVATSSGAAIWTLRLAAEPAP
jgi:hypothetical protein